MSFSEKGTRGKRVIAIGAAVVVAVLAALLWRLISPAGDSYEERAEEAPVIGPQNGFSEHYRIKADSGPHSGEDMPRVPADVGVVEGRMVRASALDKDREYNLQYMNGILRMNNMDIIAPEARIEEDLLPLFDEAWESANARVEAAEKAWYKAADGLIEEQRVRIREAIAKGEDPNPHVYQPSMPREAVRFEVTGEVRPSRHPRSYPLRAAPIGEYRRFGVALEEAHRYRLEVIDKTIRLMFDIPEGR